jgi:hypothetical protein
MEGTGSKGTGKGGVEERREGGRKKKKIYVEGVNFQ